MNEIEQFEVTLSTLKKRKRDKSDHLSDAVIMLEMTRPVLEFHIENQLAIRGKAMRLREAGISPQTIASFKRNHASLTFETLIRIFHELKKLEEPEARTA